MGDHNHSHSRRDRNFIVFAEASGMVEPGKGTLNDPAPRELFPLMRFDPFRYVHIKAKFLPDIGHKSPSIACVSTELLNRRIVLTGRSCGKNPRLRIMNIGGMDDYRQQIPQCIYNDVSFPPFRFFPPSIPRSSLAATVFTL